MEFTEESLVFSAFKHQRDCTTSLKNWKLCFSITTFLTYDKYVGNVQKKI